MTPGNRQKSGHSKGVKIGLTISAEDEAVLDGISIKISKLAINGKRPSLDSGLMQRNNFHGRRPARDSGAHMECVFCGSYNHWSENCRWQCERKRPREALEKVKQAGLCVLCLKRGHSSRICRRKMRPVEGCGREHFWMLHHFRHERLPVNPSS